jgi:hypothetical protein
VCNDAASEGLNLQTADALINYDLPWNPMRVEQRIGRIDRIGQENDEVEIINYAYEDSIDGDIYEQLEERLDLFENVVGKMRPVLSDLKGNIRSAAMSDTTDEDDVDSVITEAEEKGEAAKEKIDSAGLGAADDLSTQEEIINEAGINGWDACHNGFTQIGKRDDEGLTPIVTPTLVERLLTESTVLEDAGWKFTSIRNHDSITEYEDVKEDVYVLQPPESYSGVSLVGDIGEGAAQNILREKSAVAVTFDPAVAADYTSLRLLLPGDPLYRDMIEVLSNSDSRIEFVCSSQDGEIVVRQDIDEVTEYETILPAIPERSIECIDDIEIPTVDEAKNRVAEYI